MRSTVLVRTATLFAALGGLVLPALFSLGYTSDSIELLAAVALVAALAVIAGAATAILPQRAFNMVCAAIAVVSTEIYLGLHLGPEAVIGISICLMVLGLVLVEGFAPMIAAASMASLGVAALNRPVFIRHETPLSQVQSTLPTVIHVILDEYGAHDSFPSHLVPPATTAAMDRWFQERGFVHARRAYSDEEWTQRSIARVLNPQTHDVLDVLRKDDKTAISTWSLQTSSALNDIAAMRRPAVASSSYFNIAAALETSTARGPVTIYNYGVPSPTLGLSGMGAVDRFRVMGALVSSWLYWRQKVMPYHNWLAYTDVGRFVFRWQQAKDRLHPLTSRLMLEEVTRKQIPQLGRGEYLLVHVLLPHHPYVFDRSCRLRPVDQWLNPFRWPDDDTMADRARRYPLYAEQIECTLTLVDQLLGAIDRNPSLRDATVILHGDHGSRIGMKDWKKYAAEGYSEQASLLDWHATLFAVRFADRKARTVDRPISLPDAMDHLVKQDFTTFDDAKLPTRDSG